MVPDLLRASGATYRQLDYWCLKGFLVPTPQDKTGSGYAREWPPEEIEVARRMVKLVKLGFTPSGASIIARAEPGTELALSDFAVVRLLP